MFEAVIHRQTVAAAANTYEIVYYIVESMLVSENITYLQIDKLNEIQPIYPLGVVVLTGFLQLEDNHNV